MHIPKFCELKIREGWLDINKYTLEWERYKMNVEHDWLPEKLRNTPNLKRIGYPRDENIANIYR